MNWTETVIDQMKSLLSEGKSSTQVAAILGTTRNAVIGKIARLGGTVSRLNGRKSYRKPRPKLTVYRTYSRLKKIKRGPIRVDKSVFSRKVKKGESKQRNLLELNSRSCRWPLWSDRATVPARRLYCGERTELGKPYCQEHCDIAYNYLQSRRLPSPVLTASSTPVNSP